MGLIDTVALVGTLVLALPIAMLGVEFVVGGRTLEGVGFLVVAVALVGGQHYLGTPGLKRRVADVVLDRFADGDADDARDASASPDEEAYKN